MNDNLQYKSRHELEQLCKQFNVKTLGLKKEDLLVELRLKLLWVNDLPRSPHRVYRSAEGISSSKKKKPTEKVFSKSASMGRTLSYLQNEGDVKSLGTLEPQEKGISQKNIPIGDDASGVVRGHSAVIKERVKDDEIFNGSEDYLKSEKRWVDTTDDPQSVVGSGGELVAEDNKLKAKVGDIEAMMEPTPAHVKDSSLSGLADTVSKSPNVIEHQQQDRVHGYPRQNQSIVSQDDSDGKFKNLEDKEMLHQVEQQGSWGSGWVTKPSAPLYSVSSMTVEVGDNPPAESLVVLSEAEREATLQEVDNDNESEVKDITCIDNPDEFMSTDSNVDRSTIEEKEIDNKESWESSAGGKNTSRLCSMSSMVVEVGDNLPAESVAGLKDAEAALEDLDILDGYEVTVVKDDASPSDDCKTGHMGQSVEALSETRDANFGLSKPSEDSTESSSFPESNLGDYVHDTPGSSNTTFVSEWVVRNASASTSNVDKDQGVDSSLAVGFPLSIVLWCSQSCSRLPVKSRQPS